MELPTVPTGSDDPDMPLDLRRQCLLMFRQPGTHTYTPLRRLARDGGSYTVREFQKLYQHYHPNDSSNKWEEAKPVDPLGDRIAHVLCKSRPKVAQRSTGCAVLKKRQQAIGEPKDHEDEDSVIQKIEHDMPAAQYNTIESREINPQILAKTS